MGWGRKKEKETGLLLLLLLLLPKQAVRDYQKGKGRGDKTVVYELECYAKRGERIGFNELRPEMSAPLPLLLNLTFSDDDFLPPLLLFI